MTSFVPRPSATFCDLGDLARLFTTLARDFSRDCAKVGSRIGLTKPDVKATGKGLGACNHGIADPHRVLIIGDRTDVSCN
jgi:hypothetical protein